MKTTRRELIKAVGAATLAPSFVTAAQNTSWPPNDAGAPKICLGVPTTIDEAGMRQIKQIGVNYVLTGGPPIPWTEDVLRTRINQFKQRAG